MVLDLVGQHLGIAHRMQSQERLSEARRECGLWLGDTIFGTGHLRGISRDKMEHSLG